MIRTQQILASNIERLVTKALHTEVKLNGTILALSVTVTRVTVTRETHAHGALASERDESEPMRYELVVEDRGIDLDFNEVNGDSWDFCYHHAPKRVGYAGVGVAQLEFHVVVFNFTDFDPWESLVRDALHCCFCFVFLVGGFWK